MRAATCGGRALVQSMNAGTMLCLSCRQARSVRPQALEAMQLRGAGRGVAARACCTYATTQARAHSQHRRCRRRCDQMYRVIAWWKSRCSQGHGQLRAPSCCFFFPVHSSSEDALRIPCACAAAGSLMLPNSPAQHWSSRCRALRLLLAANAPQGVCGYTA